MNRHEIGFKGICLRAAEEGDGRTLEGIAVPFGSIIDTWKGAETFDPDCRFDDVDNAKLCYQHGELIGRITGAESRNDGLHITARISDTQRGRDVVALLRTALSTPVCRLHPSAGRNRQAGYNPPQACPPAGNERGQLARL